MPHRVRTFAVLLVAVAAMPSSAGDDVTDLLKQVRSVGPQGAGSPAARAAWDRLVARGPAVLPALLEAMDTPDTVAANWLRTAFDRIVDQAAGKGIDADALLRFARESQRQGRARRLALEVVEELRPGTRAGCYAPGRTTPNSATTPSSKHWPISTATRNCPAVRRVATLRDLFAVTRRPAPVPAVAGKLKELGARRSAWPIISASCATGTSSAPSMPAVMKGFKHRLSSRREGRSRRRYDCPARARRWLETLPSPRSTTGTARRPGQPARAARRRRGRGGLRLHAFTVAEAREVEFRGAADDNLSVWVNGDAGVRLRGVSQRRASRPAPLPGPAQGRRQYGAGQGVSGAVRSEQSPSPTGSSCCASATRPARDCISRPRCRRNEPDRRPLERTPMRDPALPRF